MTTLTVDGSPEESGELSAEEQDSLAVGEQMEQEQEQLFAGKYKNAEELESAYIELQKKLGSSDSESEPEEEAESEDAPEETTSFLDEIWEQSQSEYKQETLDKLRGMDPTELATCTWSTAMRCQSKHRSNNKCLKKLSRNSRTLLVVMLTTRT